MTLNEYFHKIVNKPPVKEPTMFELLKAKWKAFWNFGYTWVEEPIDIRPAEDYWSFEMVTNEWINEDGETVPVKKTCIIEPHNGTWFEVLDRILDEMEKHHGYNIKEQVYYSVHFPLNDPEFAGHGRCLNDERLQQILLAFPELYESVPFSTQPEKAMFQ